MTFRKRALVAAVAAATLSLAGCSGSGGDAKSSGARAGDSELIVAVPSPPTSLKTFSTANGSPLVWPAELAYASVLNVDNDNNIAAGLASKWGYVGDDNTHFRFTLRDDLVFADGTAMTAKEVVASFDAFVEAATGSVSGYFEGWTFAATGDNEVEITTPTPNPNIPLLLTPNYYLGDVISPAGVADMSKLASATYGAGQYVLDTKATIDGNKYVYTKNSNYYDQSQIAFDSITVQVIPSPTQQVQALETGQVDLIATDASVGGSATGEKLVEIQHPQKWSGIFLTDRAGTIVPALASQKVRQALNYAVDRDAITKAAYGDYGTPTVQPTVRGDQTGGYDEALASSYPYDVQKAKDLLAEAGYADGFTIPMLYQSFDSAGTTAVQAIASQLEQVNVMLKLKPEPSFSAWVNDFKSNKYAATYLGSGGGPLFLSAQFGWTTNAPMNPFRVTDQHVKAAFSDLTAASQDDVPQAARDLMKVLVEQAVAMPIAEVDQIFMYDKSEVGGVQFMGDSGNLNPITAWTRAE